MFIGRVAELVDAMDSKSIDGNIVRVQVPPRPQNVNLRCEARMKKYKNIIRIAVGTGLLLLIPLVLQLTIGTGVDGQGFNWELGDFVIMGVLIFSTGLAIDFAVRKINKRSHRIFSVIAIVLILLLTWAELAVGIFGTPFAGS